MLVESSAVMQRCDCHLAPPTRGCSSGIGKSVAPFDFVHNAVFQYLGCCFLGTFVNIDVGILLPFWAKKPHVQKPHDQVSQIPTGRFCACSGVRQAAQRKQGPGPTPTQLACLENSLDCGGIHLRRRTKEAAHDNAS